VQRHVQKTRVVGGHGGEEGSVERQIFLSLGLGAKQGTARSRRKVRTLHALRCLVAGNKGKKCGEKNSIYLPFASGHQRTSMKGDGFTERGEGPYSKAEKSVKKIASVQRQEGVADMQAVLLTEMSPNKKDQREMALRSAVRS